MHGRLLGIRHSSYPEKPLPCGQPLHVRCWLSWLWGEPAVAMIPAICPGAQGLQSPVLGTHKSRHVAHCSMTTLGSVHAIFIAFLVI